METFVVRVWPHEESGGLRGVVRHVRTGLEVRFSSAAELEAALRTVSTTESKPEAPTPGA